MTKVHGFLSKRPKTPPSTDDSNTNSDETMMPGSAEKQKEPVKKGKPKGQNISSFTGGAAAGWVIQILHGGPTIYHSGDTNSYSDMNLVDRFYKPTHVLMPTGVATTSTPAAAAHACHTYLHNCHTVIPMTLKSCFGDYELAPYLAIQKLYSFSPSPRN